MAPSGRNLVRVELSFVSEDDAEQLGDRIKESVANIVGWRGTSTTIDCAPACA